MSKHKPETRRRLNAKYRERNRLKLRKLAREHKTKLKEEVLERYGKVCAKCGYADSRALHLDHINNDGFKERKELGGQHISGHTFYTILKKKGFPEGYQILCANCNLIKHIENKERLLG